MCIIQCEINACKIPRPFGSGFLGAVSISMSSLTCKHIAVEFLQFEGIIVEFLDHFSGLITNAVLRPHFPENQQKIKVFLFIPRTKYTVDAFNVICKNGIL